MDWIFTSGTSWQKLASVMKNILSLGLGVALIGSVPAEEYHYIVDDDPDVACQSPARPRRDQAGPAGKGPPLPPKRHAYGAQVARHASVLRLDSALLHAVIAAESGYNPVALSPRGAMGLMQLMPGTARRYGVRDPFDPEQNLRGGSRYLRDLLQRFDNNIELALAAYNAGEEAVVRHGNRVPPYRETQEYVPLVLGLYERYCRSL